MRLADDICAIRNRDYIIDITLKFFHALFLFGLERNMIKYMIKYKSHTHTYMNLAMWPRLPLFKE